MSSIRWLLMSRYKKLLFAITVAKNNQQRLHLPNDIVLDFTEDNLTVVRCKDCKYSRNGKYCYKKFRSTRKTEKVYPTYFCASGKRKEDSHDNYREEL